jgi:DNA-binding transcriptional ArsR family regulator
VRVIPERVVATPPAGDLEQCPPALDIVACTYYHVNMQQALSGPVLDLIAGRLKVLADPTRLRILDALRAGERSVLELARAAGTGQPNASRHLALLLKAGLVANRQDGRQVFYRVVDPFIEPICDAICGSLRAHFEVQQHLAETMPRPRTRRRAS